MWLAPFLKSFPMRLSVLFLLLACTAQLCFAQDKAGAKPEPDAGLCKAGCVSARQDCRALVTDATEKDTSPVLTMKPDTNPYAAAAREVWPQSQQLRPTEAEAFRSRRAERLQACEVQYRSCTRACP